ncbi:MAG: hypothetical protein K9K78_06560, partial [Spirochaetales bacterium]|nr:hypothetical protein [Spirochaetales bacterium]
MKKMILMKKKGIGTVSLIPVMILFLLSASFAFAGGTEAAPIVEEELVQSAEEISASEVTTEDAEPVEEVVETEVEAVTDEGTEAGEEKTASTGETDEP